jgi:DNA invertase Pin-like site-specific DNA recombinase
LRASRSRAREWSWSPIRISQLSFAKDRQRAGIEAAKAEGVYKGRKVKFDPARILELRKQGVGATEIANAVGCKRGAVYLALKAAGSAS